MQAIDFVAGNCGQHTHYYYVIPGAASWATAPGAERIDDA